MRNYEFKLTPAYCLYNGIAVVRQNGSHICFMTENPADAVLRNRLKKAFSNFLEYVLRQQDCPQNFKSTPSVVFVPGNRTEIRKYVSSLYSLPEQKSCEKGGGSEQNNKQENEAAAVILLDTIILEARKRNATDIHIENNCIKFRICGRLEVYSSVSQEKTNELIQRIKFLAGMNVLEKRRSQDGHFIYGKENPVFIRVSVMGVIGDAQNDSIESVVIRLLDTRRLPLALDKLGFTQSQTACLKSLSQEKNGLVVICGPTGVGKSTTAAALLVDIEMSQKNSIKIVSLEDPPEYVIPGITQIQIDEKIENSFSDALKHVFRQDPDVLMIGEIRDENSAAVAIRAALTGHLVIATLHASSASGAVLRLANLGVPENLIVSVLKGVVVQELKPVCNNVILAADISIPKTSLEKSLEKSLTEDELEKHFEHNTNYSQILETSLGMLKDRHTAASGELVEEGAAQVAEEEIIALVKHRKSGKFVISQKEKQVEKNAV